MNKTDQEKIKRFLADKIMANAVKTVLNQTITKPCKDRDVNILASRFLAIEVLQEAWKELEKYKADDEPVNKITNQVGL
jgi:hypothetical protein